MIFIKVVKNNPKKFLFLLNIIGLLTILLMQQKIASLEKEIDTLGKENEDYYEAITYLSDQDFFQETNPISYSTWKESSLIAKEITSKSENKFKYEWALFLVRQANRYDIDPYLVFELLKVETGGKFNPNLVGPDTKYGNAYGLGQFMKNTAPWVAKMGGLKYKDELLLDPYYSIQLSIVYLDYLSNRYDNDWNKALTAYHRGIGGLENYMNKNGHAKSWYAKKILSNANEHKMIAFKD